MMREITENIFKYDIYYLVAHAQTNTHTLKFLYLCHTLKLACVCVCT